MTNSTGEQAVSNEDIRVLLAAMDPREQERVLRSMPEEERATLDEALRNSLPIWVPLEGPQTKAMESEADIVFYGGAAGGGKTECLIGLALTQHRKSIIFRREATQLTGIIDRMTEMLGGRDGYNGTERIWRVPSNIAGMPEYKVQIEFGSTPNPGDETRYQGRPHDLCGFDEVCNMLEDQFRFLMGWLRTTIPGQRCRVVCTGNPPTTPEGEWVRGFWSPWLDPEHPDPAAPGELRWYYSRAGEDHPISAKRVALAGVTGQKFVYDESVNDLRPATDEELRDISVEKITPQSRTYIPSRIADNPYLLNTGYMATLQALPEPLRSQMLYGDFAAGHEDDAWQVLPSGWVEQAQARWKKREQEHEVLGTQTAIGVDVSRGGKDEAVIAIARGDYVDELIVIPGKDIPDGPALGAEVLRVRRDQSVINVDAIGVGSSVLDFLNGQGVDVVAVTGSEKATGRDMTNTFTFRNLRAKIYWRLRERLDPKNQPTICLPPDSKMLADLCSARYHIREGNILVIESKSDIYSRLKRSPDRADGIVYALWEDSQRFEVDFFEQDSRGPQDPLGADPYSRAPAAAFAAGYSQGVRHARYR